MRTRSPSRRPRLHPSSTRCAPSTPAPSARMATRPEETPMRDAFICDAARTAIGRYGGGVSKGRAGDLAAVPIRALVRRNAKADWSALDEVVLGCANQAGEDNRNVARMALLLAGLPVEVAGQTVNRLCGSGLQAVNAAAHAIWSGQGEMFVTGGVESMTRAPLVMLKPDGAYPRGLPPMADSTLGWRFPHPELEADGHTATLGQTAENVAERRGVSRQDQDAFAVLSQQKAGRGIDSGRLGQEIAAVAVPQSKAEPL